MKLFDKLGAKHAVAAVAVPAAVLMGATGVATTASAAPQQQKADVAPLSCSHSHSNKDSGEGRVDATWLKRRSGPHTSCTAYGQEKDGTLIYYHCWTRGTGGTWTYGRVAGSQKYGWFKDEYLSDNGASYQNKC